MTTNPSEEEQLAKKLRLLYWEGYDSGRSKSSGGEGCHEKAINKVIGEVSRLLIEARIEGIREARDGLVCVDLQGCRDRIAELQAKLDEMKQ